MVAAQHVRRDRCSMCQTPVNIRRVQPAAEGAKPVEAYMCGMCDRRRCKCGAWVQDAHRTSCTCGRNLRAA